jgi:hypothetical protein
LTVRPSMKMENEKHSSDSPRDVASDQVLGRQSAVGVSNPGHGGGNLFSFHYSPFSVVPTAPSGP